MLIEEKNLNLSTIQIAINELFYDEKKYKSMKEALEKVNEVPADTIIYNKIKELIDE